jgi:hypothetical protein
MNGYDLSRQWFDFAFENPERISPNHAAIYFFAIEHNNRLGWREKFGFPTQMAMDAVGIKKASTYKRYFDDLVEWGFFVVIQASKNQYSANIITLHAANSAKPKNGKPLDKAIVKHAAKQTEGMGQSMGQSKWPIDKPLTIEPINQLTVDLIDFSQVEKVIHDSMMHTGLKAIHSEHVWGSFRSKEQLTEFESMSQVGRMLYNFIKKSDWSKVIGINESDWLYASGPNGPYKYQIADGKQINILPVDRDEYQQKKQS